MPSYVVDSEKSPFTATGIVEPVPEWEEISGPGGERKRRPSDRQARHPDTGMPLWGVEVLYVQTSYGRLSTCTAKVTVESVEEPQPAPLSAISFVGLTVDVRINKAGGYAEYWTAEGIGTLEPVGKPTTNAGQGGVKAAAS